MQRLATLRYDYGQIAQEQRATVQSASLAIRARLKRTIEDMIEIGRQLNEVKAHFPHGEFDNWLAQEFGMSRATASEFRNVADRFMGKSTIIVHLTPTTARILAAPSVPDEVVEAVIELNNARLADDMPPLMVSEVRELKRRMMPARPGTPRVRPKQLPAPAVAEAWGMAAGADLRQAADLVVTDSQIVWPNPPSPPEPEPQVIEAEYTVVPVDADLLTLSMSRSMVRKLQVGALRNQRFWDMFEPQELDRLNIIFSKALKQEG